MTDRPEPNQRDSANRFWTFLRILNVRLRFVILMVLVGLVAGYWDSIVNHIDRWRRPVNLTQSAEDGRQGAEYYCPMHPSIIRDQPGNCPICGMPLAERARTTETVLPAGVLARVQLTPQKVQLGRIGTTPVEYRLLAREVRTVGIVDYDETRRAFIAARIKGRIDRLMVNFTGQHVEKGDPLASIYSPDLLVAQEELLSAARTRDQQKNAGEFATMSAQAMLDAARKKLLLWGITEEQISDILKRGSPETHLTVYSPMSGIVTEKKVLEGHYVMEGEDLYTIADLSRVWMQAQIFEDEVAGIKVGTAVEVTSTAYPNELFAGRITFIAYTVDPLTRTVSARVEIANPDLKLKPGMYANAVIRLPAGQVTELTASQPTTTQAATAEVEYTCPMHPQIVHSEPGTCPICGMTLTRRARTASAPAPTSTQPGAGASDRLARAYLDLWSAFTNDKADAAAIEALARAARGAAAENKSANEIADLAAALKAQDTKTQREQFKTLSARTIEYLRKYPPALDLYIAHCPMVEADWLQDTRKIANPYDPGNMLTCGEITGAIKAGPATMPHQERFATGYYCPVYPNRLFDHPAACPVDKFPMKYVRVDKVLAVPESAVVNTGARQIVYRESEPGTFDMIEVTLGPRAGEFYPVVSGLAEGDLVATAGAFLVDAENRLNPAAGAQYLGAGGK